MPVDQVFVYGSLLFPEVFQKVTGEVPRSSRASVRGFSRYTIVDRPVARVPALISEASGCVIGKVYHHISDQALARLDAFEHIASGKYARVVVDIECADDGRQQAYTYIAGDAIRPLLGAPWDPDHFARQDLARYLAAFGPNGFERRLLRS